MSSRMQGGSPLTVELKLDQCADPGCLRLYNKMKQVNWNQYIECTSMRVGMLNTSIKLEMD